MIDVAAGSGRGRRRRRRYRRDRVVVERRGPDFVVNGERETFPKSYGECMERYPDGVCPWFRCSMNNAVDVDDEGRIGTNCGRVMTNAPRRYARAVESRKPLVTIRTSGDVWEERARELVRETIEADRPTCALFLSRRTTVETMADGEDFLPLRTLEEMGDVMNVTRERARQIEVRAMRDVGAELERLGVDMSNVEAIARALGPDEVGVAMLVMEAVKFRAYERTVVVLREARRALAFVAARARHDSAPVMAAAVLTAIAMSIATQGRRQDA